MLCIPGEKAGYFFAKIENISCSSGNIVIAIAAIGIILIS